MEEMNRRDFAGMVAALLGTAALATAQAEGQAAAPAAGAAAAPRQLAELKSGVFKPQPGRGMVGGHESHQFLAGMLAGGTIRLEMHESVQQAGAPHEAVGTHKHSEIWLMQRGMATLYLNGTEYTMNAGDVGLCYAGDEHWIANKSDGEIAYFVVTVGPPE
ncbi:MAG: cupin domain-containing protein [Acidobacteriaceae bacterium]|jgi:mannose-6-phosphate isomerase-like protein (cupin superfamily)